MADEAHAQATVLGLDDHYPFAFDQLALYERLLEDDDPVHQPLPVGLALRQGKILFHQESLRVALVGIPPGHLCLVFAHFANYNEKTIGLHRVSRMPGVNRCPLMTFKLVMDMIG